MLPHSFQLKCFNFTKLECFAFIASSGKMKSNSSKVAFSFWLLCVLVLIITVIGLIGNWVVSNICIILSRLGAVDSSKTYNLQLYSLVVTVHSSNSFTGAWGTSLCQPINTSCALLTSYGCHLELQTKVCKDFSIKEKAYTKAFSCLRAPTSQGSRDGHTGFGV